MTLYVRPIEVASGELSRQMTRASIPERCVPFSCAGADAFGLTNRRFRIAMYTGVCEGLRNSRAFSEACNILYRRFGVGTMRFPLEERRTQMRDAHFVEIRLVDVNSARKSSTSGERF